MVKPSPHWRAAAVGLLLVLALTASAAPARRSAPYELDRQTLALGEPLQLSITRAIDAAGGSLEALDLSPLQRDFEILERTLGRDSQQERLTLMLYPRRLGRIELPTLGLPGRAPSVMVSEGSDTVPKVHWKTSLDPAEPLLRQASIFTLEACDDGTLLWKRPLLHSVEGLLLRPLNETEIITQRDGQRCTAHRWHWALLPTRTGPLTLALPVLEAGKFGQRLRFVPPALELTARPLPTWLPAEAAVGQPEIVAEPLPKQAVRDQPLAWRLRVSGSYSAQALQTLLDLQLRQGSAPAELAAYAPRVETLATMNAVPTHLVTLYLVPRARGVWTLPELLLPWYDPHSGRLLQARLPGPSIEVIDPVRQGWLAAAAVLAGLIAAVLLLFWLWTVAGWRLRRRRALKLLKRCGTQDALCQQLQAFSLQRDAAPAPTLRTWEKRMDAQLASSGLVELVTTLERHRFGRWPGLASSTNLPGATGQEEALQASFPVAMEALMQQACVWLASVQPNRSRAPWKEFVKRGDWRKR